MHRRTFHRTILGIASGIALTLALGRCGPIAPSVPKGFRAGSELGGADQALGGLSPKLGWLAAAKVNPNSSTEAVTQPNKQPDGFHWSDIAAQVISDVKNKGSHTFSFPGFTPSSISVTTLAIYAHTSEIDLYFSQHLTLAFDLTQDLKNADNWVLALRPDADHADFVQWAQKNLYGMVVDIRGDTTPETAPSPTPSPSASASPSPAPAPAPTGSN